MKKAPGLARLRDQHGANRGAELSREARGNRDGSVANIDAKLDQV